MLGQREIAPADDEDYAHFFVCQILRALKKGNLSNHPFHLNHPWLQVQLLRLAVFFINTGNHEWRSKWQRYSNYGDKHSLPW